MEIAAGCFICFAVEVAAGMLLLAALHALLAADTEPEGKEVVGKMRSSTYFLLPVLSLAVIELVTRRHPLTSPLKKKKIEIKKETKIKTKTTCRQSKPSV